MSDSMMTIGKVAKQARMTPETIRFYEREGLLAEPQRSHTGYRLYTPAVMSRLHFIKKTRYLGLSLEEIKEIFSMARRSQAPCCRVRELLAGKLTELEEKISEFKRLRDEVNQFIDSIAGLPDQANSSESVCELIETMPTLH